MTSLFKLTSAMVNQMREDLSRPHPYAAERVGFVRARCGWGPGGELIILAQGYRPVDDGDYIRDLRYGALIGSGAFRKELQFAYFNEVGLFHVHAHPGRGRPAFSPIDKEEMRRFVPDFFHARPDRPHGALVLSRDSAIGRLWLASTDGPRPIDRIVVVGSPMREYRHE